MELGGELRNPPVLAFLSYLLIKTYYTTGTAPPVSLHRHLTASEGQNPRRHQMSRVPRVPSQQRSHGGRRPSVSSDPGGARREAFITVFHTGYALVPL